ncbi:hypothetical protein AgCh_012503 [Apium graveolens]
MIRLEDEEDGGLIYKENQEEIYEIDTRWCLVGRFLTESSVDFQAMQHKMASLWRPGKGMYVKELDMNCYIFLFYHEVDIARVIEGKGMYVKELDMNRYIFLFYHEVDIARVIEGSSWTFERFQLVFVRLREGDDPRTVNINTLDLWVQLHGIQVGFMSQRVVIDVGNYIGHGEKFCNRIFETPLDQIEKPYGAFMKAEQQRRSHTIGAIWLRQGNKILICGFHQIKLKKILGISLGVMKKSAKQEQNKVFSRRVARDRALEAGDRVPASGRVETAGDRVRAEFQNLDFINLSTIGLLLALVLLNAYINLMGRRFHQSRARARRLRRSF